MEKDTKKDDRREQFTRRRFVKRTGAGGAVAMLAGLTVYATGTSGSTSGYDAVTATDSEEV